MFTCASCRTEFIGGPFCSACGTLRENNGVLHTLKLMDVFKIFDGNYDYSPLLHGKMMVGKTVIISRSFDFHIVDNTPLVHSVETGRWSQRDCRKQAGYSYRWLKIDDILSIRIRARTFELFVDRFIAMHETECARVLSNYPYVLHMIITEYAQNDVLDWFHLLALFFGYRINEDGRRVYDPNPELKIANFMIRNGSKKRKLKM